MNGFRLVEGFSDHQFESRTGLPVSVMDRPLAPMQERGLVARHANGWRTTPQGFRFLNDILVALLD
jgi:coproporphyrinogen III oxidase-like Fe-S oxidoreductase